VRPIVKKNLAVFYPQGFLDGQSAKMVIEQQDGAYLLEKRPEFTLVSLKKIVFFNKRGLDIIVEELLKVGEKIGAVIGFCDYDFKKYKMILDMYQRNFNFSLFETSEIATLFMNGASSKNLEEKKIIVYSEDSEQKNHLIIELYERGYKPFVPKSLNEFKTLRKDYDFAISHSYIDFLNRPVQAHIKENVIVYTLKDFVDSTLSEKFDMRYHENSLKVGFVFFLFNAHNVSSMNIHGVNFLAKLSTAAAEYSATIAICGLTSQSITSALQNDLEDAGILLYPSMKDFFDDKTLLNESKGGAISGTKKEHITKQLVEILPIVTQTAMSTVEVMTKLKVVKKSLKIEPLTLEESSSNMGVAIAFYGDLNGLLILIFEEELAKRACKVFLEELEPSREDLLDALGEFVNIIGGKFVQQMQKKQCKIDITMPRTFDNTSKILQNKKDKKGAQINFSVDGKDLTLFLTR